MLKEYRQQLGITIKEASNVCNVPLRTYIRYENDDNYGNATRLYKLSKVFGCNMEDQIERGQR